MRIPTSVIVMSLVTAVPFGLAIRDTVRHHDPVPEDDDFIQAHAVDDPSEARLAEARYQAEAERAEAEAAVARAAVERARQAVVGSTPASLGSIFDGIALGEPTERFSLELARRATDPTASAGNLHVDFDVDAVRVAAIHVSLLGDCDSFVDTLRRAWGDTPDATPDIWLTADGTQRASLDTDTCELVFERHVSTLAWVDALPLDAIGWSAKKLATAAGPAAEVDDQQIQWSTPGVGLGRGRTDLTAYLLEGKVAAIRAAFQTDQESANAIRDRLAIRFHAKPSHDDPDSNAYVWKRKVPVSFEAWSPPKLELVIGTIP
jgi:hypothetical protein